MRLTVATYNIHFGVGMDGAYDLSRIAEAVADADIVCFQEVIQGWQATGHADQAAELARLLDRYYVHGSTFNVDASTVAGDGRIENRRRTFGNMVAARWPIAASRTLALPHSAEAGVFDLQRCAVESIVDVPGNPLRAYSVHLSHISPPRRRPQVRALLDIVRHAPEHGRAWDHEEALFRAQGLASLHMPRSALVLGDFNFAPDEPEYPLICGERGADGRRQPGLEQLLDAWVQAGNDETAGASFQDQPTRPGYRIDHCFVTPDLRGTAKRAWIGEDLPGSDHLPVFFEFDL